MILNAFERLTLLQLLPGEGDITTLRIMRDLSSSLGFSEDEIKNLNLKNEGSRVIWDTTADKPKDVEIGTAALGKIREVFKKLSDSQKLQIAHVPLYERFERGE